MAVEALELLRDGEQPVDHRLLLPHRLQPRLVGDRPVEPDRGRRVERDHLGDAVDLAVGHLQHAADVANAGPRLQRPEGDDLGDVVGAVFLLDVVDHLVAAVLAEVDVEVGHRHPVRIEEALEQEAEAERIEIGDGQRPGDHRAGAGAATGTDRDRLPLCPLNEVGDDEEVARIFHPLDDAELIFQPLAVLLGRQSGSQTVSGETVGESVSGGLAESLRFRPIGGVRVGVGAGEARQDGSSDGRPPRRAQGDFHSVGNGFRQVAEQLDHRGPGLEIVLRRQPPAIIVADHRAFRDADQRVVGLVVFTGREERLVGGDQRQIAGVGELEELRLDELLARQAVALDLDIEGIGK